MIESLLLTTARVSTFFGTQGLTGASGFFFQRDERLYLVTNRHVLIDRPSGHLPDRIEIEVHTDADNLTHAAVLSVRLYRDGHAIWHQGRDSAGDIDVAAGLHASALAAPASGSQGRHTIAGGGLPLGFTTRCTIGRWCGRPSSRRRSACVSRARVTS